jgi:hypothetical protein
MVGAHSSSGVDREKTFLPLPGSPIPQLFGPQPGHAPAELLLVTVELAFDLYSGLRRGKPTVK